MASMKTVLTGTVVLFVAALTFAPTLTSEVMGFNTFEHRYIGNVAFDGAIDRANSTWGNSADHAGREAWGHYHTDLQSVAGEIFGRRTFRGEPGNFETHLAVQFLREVPFQFGDIPALAGDHAKTPNTLNEMVWAFADPTWNIRQDQKRRIPSKEAPRILATRRQWMNACRWFANQTTHGNTDVMAECFKEMHPPGYSETLGPPNVYASQGYVPTRTELAEFENLPGYVGLVEN